ncbi:MAG: argininosuccinate lyase [Phycisphaeraceae bacterium]|nr:argininosuccinate lyase [Phycisphaeraceae bacterium]
MSNSNLTAKPWEHAKTSGSEADPLAIRFVESLSYDRRLYRHDIRGSIAHARMLKQVGLIAKADLNAIEHGLAEIMGEIDQQGDAWTGWKIELEDVHMCLEAALIAKIGDPGRKLHTGRSRNDQVALDLKLWIADAAEQLRGKFKALFLALIALAKRDGNIVMPSYTHLQRAQPIVAGAEIMAWLTAFDRARHRLDALLHINRNNPLGSGAIAGSALPLDRDVTAFTLDLGEPSPSSIDATASRDVAIDLAYALSMTAMWLSRWAEQWIIYLSSEFGFLTIGEAYTTGSSMMPQKRNPDMLELIRGRCGNAYGHLVGLLTMCKGITIGYNRDLQEDKRQLFAAYDMVCDSLDMAARIVATAKFQEDRIASTLDRGHLDATALAEYLVTRGVPFRTAHQIVGKLVRQAGDKPLSSLDLQAFQTACQEAGQPAACDQTVYDWLSASNVVRRYQSRGNAGVTGFQEQLAAWEQRFAAAPQARP